ncbi:MAG: XdhC/CoxI family protein [Acidobacteria bacterium]|nr:MAG: XdhC/CoxI family protein [Acidobacteriota bacterium]REK02768.1 MAG: XdhC/CoxI family protein [Acidobacteriota bacterium]REK13427.1 MAG: XdhC/CoxI family protein [Acidobacteriota bacterium]REK41421.1 MAG: XdhC/CoxI family protein [Acidobacteriota bacterium]
MKELREIVAAIRKRSGPAALATVVDVQGSSYRLPGSKMLVFSDGSFVGTVSGGCIEADVLERASRVIISGSPELFFYDTTKDDSSVFSLNMGCKGIVRILLERVDKSSDYLNAFAGSIELGTSGFVVTKLDDGHDQTTIERSFLGPDGSVDQGTVPREVSELIREMSSAGGARRPAEIVEAEGAEYFVESSEPPLHLVIFGAGADAIPLADIAVRIGWRVSVYDHRPVYADENRFPSVADVIVGRPDKALGKIGVGPKSAAVVMSHNFENDKAYAKALLESDVAYIGMLGPKVRTAELLSSIADATGSGLERIHAPVGLDTGAAEPETIAVSIIAEIQSVFAGRSGGFLREREGSIYDR